MSWASEKAAEIFRWGRPTMQVPFGTNRLATIERAIRETIEEAAKRCDEGRWASGAGADHGAQHCRARILAMLVEG